MIYKLYISILHVLWFTSVIYPDFTGLPVLYLYIIMIYQCYILIQLWFTSVLYTDSTMIYQRYILILIWFTSGISWFYYDLLCVIYPFYYALPVCYISILQWFTSVLYLHCIMIYQLYISILLCVTIHQWYRSSTRMSPLTAGRVSLLQTVMV